ATNVATLGAVYRAFGGRIVGIYLGTIVIGSVAFGLLYEATLGAVTVSSVAGGHAHTAWWAQLAAVVLVGMIVWFIGEDARLWLARRRAAASAAAQVTVSVSGMTCGGCASRLERLMMQLDGVESVTVSLEPGSVTVAGAVSADGVREVVEQAGFQAVA
ncbi:MAG: copper chaperone CopZ, partial [Myxococcota bacterium]